MISDYDDYVAACLTSKRYSAASELLNLKKGWDLDLERNARM